MNSMSTDRFMGRWVVQPFSSYLSSPSLPLAPSICGNLSLTLPPLLSSLLHSLSIYTSHKHCVTRLTSLFVLLQLPIFPHLLLLLFLPHFPFSHIQYCSLQPFIFYLPFHNFAISKFSLHSYTHPFTAEQKLAGNTAFVRKSLISKIYTLAKGQQFTEVNMQQTASNICTGTLCNGAGTLFTLREREGLYSQHSNLQFQSRIINLRHADASLHKQQ